MDSLVDMYLLQEFAKNIDAGWSSFFMYREVGGKLTFGAPWDFDLAFGNDGRLDNGSPLELYVGPGRPGQMQNHEWYNKLYEHAWFREMAAKRWNEISNSQIKELIEAVKAMAEYISADMEENYKLWKFLGKRQQQEPSQVYRLTTYKEHIDYLISWMNTRKNYLDKEFSS